MIHRHLEYEPGTPVEHLGLAALDDLLDRGDLDDWAPLARAIASEPHGPLADAVLALCRAHPMYGTSQLWTTWIDRLRDAARPPAGAPPARLGELRRRRGLTQHDIASVLRRAQSDVSKLERRSDVRLSTLRAYVEATGGRLRVLAAYPDGEVVDIDTGSSDPPAPDVPGGSADALLEHGGAPRATRKGSTRRQRG